MPGIVLTQAEADALLALEKHRADDEHRSFPSLGGAITAPLVSADKREDFLLDVSRGRIDRAKLKYQTRSRVIVILARLDIAGSPHRNPDGQGLPCPHLHLYREGFADKWAFPVEASDFTDLTDAWTLLEDFQRYCNVTQPPLIQRGLFT